MECFFVLSVFEFSFYRFFIFSCWINFRSIGFSIFHACVLNVLSVFRFLHISHVRVTLRVCVACVYVLACVSVYACACSHACACAFLFFARGCLRLLLLYGLQALRGGWRGCFFLFGYFIQKII